MSKTPLKSSVSIVQSDHPDIACYAKLVGPNGMFVDFSIDLEMAEQLHRDLEYQIARYKELRANAPKPIPPNA